MVREAPCQHSVLGYEHTPGSDSRVVQAQLMANQTPAKQPENVCASYNVNHPAATSVSSCKQTSIDDLSDDILLPIIRWVGIGSEERSRRDLFNLAVCSRRFHQLVEPELYSKFRQNKEQQFLLFLRRILARPDLARCLRRLSGTACSHDALLPVESELTDEDWTRIRTIVNGASRSEHEAYRWVNAVELGQWDAIISLLLSLTPNLEELEINDWSYRNEDYGHVLDGLERARNLQDSCEESPFSMSKLRSVSVIYHHREIDYSFDHVIPFLKLKSVQAFSGHMVSQDSSHSEELNDQRLMDTYTAETDDERSRIHLLLHLPQQHGHHSQMLSKSRAF